MLKQWMFIFITALAAVACAQNGTATEENAAQAVAVKGETFGEAITAEGAMTYEALLAKMENTTEDSVAVKVVGTVDAVCQMKGCWMNLVSDAGDSPEMAVRFKDYGFFVPKDIAGRKVIVEGYAFKEVTPVDELRHYAEDAGKSKEEIEAITEPKEELKFLASGVFLVAANE